jgi:hypothetical protein
MLKHFRTPNTISFFQDVPGLMLPSFLVQLLVEIVLLHKKFFLVSGVEE